MGRSHRHKLGGFCSGGGELRRARRAVSRAHGTQACGNDAACVEMLAGCDAVICGGTGQGAAVALAAHGIRALVAPAAAGTGIDDALQPWIEGRLATSDERACLCSH